MLIISVCTITRKNVPSKIFHLNLFEVLSSGIFHFLQFDLDYWGFVSSTEISQLAKNEANFARVNRKSCMCTGIVYKLLPLFMFRLTYLIFFYLIFQLQFSLPMTVFIHLRVNGSCFMEQQ